MRSTRALVLAGLVLAGGLGSGVLYAQQDQQPQGGMMQGNGDMQGGMMQGGGMMGQMSAMMERCNKMMDRMEQKQDEQVQG
jgi:hypothetical protein